jgi:hypothetical protein
VTIIDVIMAEYTAESLMPLSCQASYGWAECGKEAIIEELGSGGWQLLFFWLLK